MPSILGFSAIPFPAIIISVIASVVAYLYFVRRKRGWDRELARKRLLVVIGGCWMFYLIAILPSVPSLSTVDFSRLEAETSDTRRMLNLIQDQNEALNKTISVIHVFIFIVIMTVLEPLYFFSKASRPDRYE